jgi:rhodanese-related sulfurtransferase
VTTRTHVLPRTTALAVAALLLLSGCGSAGFAFVVGIDEITAAELAARLDHHAPPLVVDVREPSELRTGRIPGSIVLGQDELPGFFTRLGPPRDHSVVFVCERGFRSVAAAAVVAPLGYSDVSSLGGGMEAWRAAGLPLSTAEPPTFPPGTLALPRLPLDDFQQFMEFAAGFVVKPGYMLLSLALALLLLRRRDSDLALIRWSLVSFFAGEAACYANIILAGGTSDGLELAHGLGMIGQNALLPWGLFLFFDRRALRFSADDQVCSLQRLCGRCWKRDDVSCALQRLFLFLLFGIGAFALLPLSAPLRPTAVVLPIYGHDWTHQMSLLIAFLQFRVYVAVALLLFLATLVLLLAGRAGTRRAPLPFFLGLGFLMFPLLRYFLEEAYRNMPVWAEWWEEATEFLAIFGTGFFLFVFRRPLGLFGHAVPARAAAGDVRGTD